MLATYITFGIGGHIHACMNAPAKLHCHLTWLVVQTWDSFDVNSIENSWEISGAKTWIFLFFSTSCNMSDQSSKFKVSVSIFPLLIFE